jgi:hypothetical protein
MALSAIDPAYDYGEFHALGDSEVHSRGRRPWAERLVIPGVRLRHPVAVHTRPLASMSWLTDAINAHLAPGTGLLLLGGGAQDMGLLWAARREASRLPFLRYTADEVDRLAQALLELYVEQFVLARRRAPDACIVALEYAPRPLEHCGALFPAGAPGRLRYAHEQICWARRTAAAQAGIWYFDPGPWFSRFDLRTLVRTLVWSVVTHEEDRTLHMNAEGDRQYANGLSAFLTELIAARPLLLTRYGLPRNPEPSSGA